MLSKPPRIEPESSHFVSTASLRVRLDWFNRLRWGALAGIIGCALAAGAGLGFELPFKQLVLVVGVLGVLNLLYVLRNRRLPPVNFKSEIRLVKLQMLGDLLALTAVLNLTGGVENPFLYLYVIHVIIASLLFKGREVWQIAWLAIGLFTAMVLLEYAHILPHHHLLSASDLTHEQPFLAATLGSFWLVMLFSAYMGQSIMRHNRAIKDELVERQSALIEADRAKVDFFRFVTHEVKSPVSTAQSAVETALELGGGQMSPAVEDMLQRGVRRLEQAVGMVNDLADLTRGGMMKPENLRQVDLVALVNRVVDNQADLSARRGIHFKLELPSEPVLMMVNESMLDKVVMNLVSNAVRYNKDKGQVTVTLTRSSGPEGSQAQLAVADQGIGIAPDEQERIFEEFYRSPAAQKVSNLGTGLGLSIVRKFVNGMGGAIALDSKPGEGSRFSVTLPVVSEGEPR